MLPKPVRIPRVRRPIQRSTRPARKKAPRKARKTTLAALKRKLWGLLKDYTRATWGNVCFTCGAEGLAGSNWHTSHFVNAGKSLAVRYAPDNLRPCCGKCNVWLRGNLAEYAVRLIDQIGGDKVRRLVRRARIVRPLTAPEARELIAAAERSGADYELRWETLIGLELDAEADRRGL